MSRRPKKRDEAVALEAPKAGTSVIWALWVGGGVLMALPFLYDGCDWLAFVSMVPWLLALDRSPDRAFLRGYVGGWVWLVLGLSWLNRVAFPATLLAATYFALYPAAYAVIVSRLRHRGGVPLWLAAPLVYVVCELLAEFVTVFNVTWLFLGHAAWRLPAYVQVAELGGISFLSAHFAATAAVIVTAIRAVQQRGFGALHGRSVLVPAATWCAVMIFALGYGTWRLRSLELHDGPTVAAVQGNVPLAERLNPELAEEVLLKHATMSRTVAASKPALVAWPESTSSHFLDDDAEARRFLGMVAHGLGSYLLVGAIGSNPAPSPPSNSAFLFAPDGSMRARSDKRVLVPGAETLLFLDAIPAIRQPICDFLSRTMRFRPYLLPGREAVVMSTDSFRFGTLICYDDVVPRPSAELRAAGAQALLSISNESWFGEREMEQHLAMATVRCIETRLPMIRSTNDGLSCAIDPAGRITKSIPRHQDGVLVAPLQVTDTWVVPAWVRTSVRMTAALAVLGLLVATRTRPLGIAP